MLLTLVAAVSLGAYALGLLRRPRHWSVGRVLAFSGGMSAVLLATSPPLTRLAHVDLRAHMLAHVLIGMIGPIGIVLGRPGTLVLVSIPRRSARALVALSHRGPVRALLHPWGALALNIGGMALIYATPLYAAMHRSALWHLLVHVHFLAAGCLYAWSIAGEDPIGGRRPSRGLRLIVLLVGAAVHAILAKAMYANGWPLGTPHPRVEIEEAAKVMYYGGDVAELLLAAALFARWRWPHRASSEPLSLEEPHGPSRAPRAKRDVVPAYSRERRTPPRQLRRS